MSDNKEYVRSLADELEEKGAFAFFEEQGIYNLEFTVDADLEYKGARVMIACGGPNIYIDTCKGSIELFWGCKETYWYLSPGCRTDVDSYFEELFNSISA